MHACRAANASHSLVLSHDLHNAVGCQKLARSNSDDICKLYASNLQATCTGLAYVIIVASCKLPANLKEWQLYLMDSEFHDGLHAGGLPQLHVTTTSNRKHGGRGNFFRSVYVCRMIRAKCHRGHKEKPCSEKGCILHAIRPNPTRHNVWA